VRDTSIHTPTRQTRKIWLTGIATAGAFALLVTTPLTSHAAEATVGLGTIGSYSVLGASTVTNTGPSVLQRDVGVSPGTAITGFPPGVTLGALHAADAPAAQAQSDLGIAYDDAAGRAPTASVAGDLVGQTLPGGVYKSTSALFVSGVLTLDGQGDPNTVFIFQVASTLITSSDSAIALVNGAQACNVFWQVGSSATLGTTSTFVGTIMALTSISVTTGTAVQGRALARTGQVSLDSNVFTTPSCATTTTSTAAPTTTVAPTTTMGPTTSIGPTTTVAPTTTAVVPTTTAASPTSVLGPTTTSPTTLQAPTTIATPTTLARAGTTTTTVRPQANAMTTSTAMATGSTLSGGVATSPTTTPGSPGPGVPTPGSTTSRVRELPHTGPGRAMIPTIVLGLLLLVLGRQLNAAGEHRAVRAR
jgi:hypothetical protein